MSNTDNEVRTEQDIINEAIAERSIALKVHERIQELEQEAAKIQEERNKLRVQQEEYNFLVPKWQRTLEEKIRKAIKERNDETN